MKDLVSIIIPTYNSAKYLKEALDSALKQTYRNTEIIVVDDGSTDNTKEILADYVNGKKIKYLYKENGGLASARNWGIKKAIGKFISFLDADDLYSLNKVERQVELFAVNDDIGVVFSKSLFFFEGNKSRKFFFKNDVKLKEGVVNDVLERLKNANFINVNTAMIKSEIFSESNILFDEYLKTSEDWDLWIRIAKAGFKFYFLDEFLCETRLRRDSLQSKLVSQKKNDIYVIRKNFGKRVGLLQYFKLLCAYIIAIFPPKIRNALISTFRYKNKYQMLFIKDE